MNYKEEIKAIISGNEHNDKFTSMIESIEGFVIEDNEDALTMLVSIFPDRITCSQSFVGCDDDTYFDLYYDWLSEEMLARIYAFVLGVENVLRTYDCE